MSYFDRLFTASFKGIPFIATGSENEHGRRLARHTYPKRDTLWPEDMGKRPSQFDVEGFVVGDDCIAQRDLIVAVCNLPGPGVLIHPTYGILSVTLESLVTRDNKEHGRKIELRFRFVEAGKKLFPALIIDGVNSILKFCGISDTASADNFITKAAGFISQGSQIVLEGVSTVGTYIALGTGLVKTATNLFSTASSLAGNFGRFFGANTGSYGGSINSTALPAAQISVQIQSLIEGAAASQALVATAGISLTAAMQSGNPADVATAAQSYNAAILAAVPSPAVAITLFSQMAQFPQTPLISNGSISAAQNGLQVALSDVFRRSAISSLAQASSLYQPTSYNDAQTIRTNICAIVDSEITIAGDAGEDDVYLSLKELRSAIVEDLTARGATLATVVQQSFQDSLPALAVAYRLYGDINRTDQVIAFANPVHPAFLPPSFQALSS